MLFGYIWNVYDVVIVFDNC